MQRSTSTARASEYFMHGTSSPRTTMGSDSTDELLLPMYDPLSDFAKKEKLRIKFAENAVHIIPLVLVLCAIVLWFFSSSETEIVNKDASILARIEGLTIDGDIEVAGAETGLLSSPDREDSDIAKKMKDKTKSEGRSTGVLVL